MVRWVVRPWVVLPIHGKENQKAARQQRIDPYCVAMAISLSLSRGRRRICIVFCATLILSLLLRLGPSYPLLVLSHILSGMAASMQFSVVEAWYVAEHSARGIPADWMSRTFAKATFLNGLVAIIAGIVANAVVDIWGFTAPFILAILLAIGAGVLITSTWSENYGEANSNQARLSRTLMDGLKTLWNGNVPLKDVIVSSMQLTHWGRFQYPYLGSRANRV